MHAAGYLEIDEPSRGPKPTVWRLAPQGPADHDTALLPAVEEIERISGNRLADKTDLIENKGVKPETAELTGKLPADESATLSELPA